MSHWTKNYYSPVVRDILRPCSQCKEHKLLDDYYKHRTNGAQSRCKKCMIRNNRYRRK